MHVNKALVLVTLKYDLLAWSRSGVKNVCPQDGAEDYVNYRSELPMYLLSSEGFNF